MFRNTRVTLSFRVIAFCLFVGKIKEIKLFHRLTHVGQMGLIVKKNTVTLYCE